MGTRQRCAAELDSDARPERQMVRDAYPTVLARNGSEAARSGCRRLAPDGPSDAHQ